MLKSFRAKPHKKQTKKKKTTRTQNVDIIFHFKVINKNSKHVYRNIRWWTHLQWMNIVRACCERIIKQFSATNINFYLLYFKSYFSVVEHKIHKLWHGAEVCVGGICWCQDLVETQRGRVHSRFMHHCQALSHLSSVPLTLEGVLEFLGYLC